MIPDLPNRSFLGVLLGFAAVFFLFVKREDKKTLGDDADALLQQAQQEMRVSQAGNRERAVQIITQKNILQALVDQAQKTVSRLEEQAEKAGQDGDAERMSDLLKEREHYSETLTRTQASLQTAIETTEAVKTAMRRQEEHIRAKTAQALGMKAHYRQMQIEFAIEKSRLGMTTTKAGDWFERAQSQIQSAQARRDLMAQIRKTAELLEAAAEEASRDGDRDLSQQMLSERDALKQVALNPRLWRDEK